MNLDNFTSYNAEDLPVFTLTLALVDPMQEWVHKDRPAEGRTVYTWAKKAANHLTSVHCSPATNNREMQDEARRVFDPHSGSYLHKWRSCWRLVRLVHLA